MYMMARLERIGAQERPLKRERSMLGSMAIRLSRAQVNSWRLSKQHLMERAPKERLARVVSDLCGVQAQVLSGAALAIWARVDNVTSGDIDDALWKHRTLVKAWCMRGTLHLLAANEFPLYVAALKTKVSYRRKSWLKFYRLSLEEIESITSAIPKALDGRGLTREELIREVARLAGLRPRVRREMLSGWGSLLRPAAYQGKLCFGPSRGQNVTFVRPDQWLGGWDEPGSEDAFTTLLRRFFTAYGPSSHEGFGHWWGTDPNQARKIVRTISEELEEVEVEGRRALVRKTDAEKLKTIRATHNIKLLPSFDAYVMFYHPREWLVPQKYRAKVFRQLAGWNSPVLLVDGLVGGVWERRQRGDRIQVSVQLFQSLTSAQKSLVEEEGAQMGEFLRAAGTDVSFSI